METQQYVQFYCCWCRCSCQLYKHVHCCHESTTFAFFLSCKIFRTLINNNKSLIFWMRVYIFAYVIPACKSHLFCSVLYCQLWPVWFCHFFTSLHKRHDFRKRILLNIKCVLILSTTFEIKWNTSLMQLGNFIDVFLARLVSGTYAHHQEH